MDQPTQTTDNNGAEEPQWFSDFLTDYDFTSTKPGQLLEGAILSIEEDGILVDIGVKRDAIVPAKDLTNIDPSVLAELKTGDTVFVYVLNRPVGDRELFVSLSKGIEHESWERAENYLDNGTAIEIEIVSHNRGGLIVEFETLRGFLPYSQVPGLRGIRNPRLAERLKRDLVGTKMEMKVIEVVRDRNRLIFSATAAEKEKRQKRLEELIKGDIITGKIVNIVDFGVFVDLDGIDGLVHLSELAWERIKHPADASNIGEEIEVKVLDVDVGRERVSLSRKALLPSPWELPEDLPKVGDCIEGRIVKLVNFGAFVELPIGIEGLVHTSQLGYTHTENPGEAVKRGETILVRVLDVSPERRRISLSMRQVPREIQIAWAIDQMIDQSPEQVEEEGESPQPEQDLTVEGAAEPTQADLSQQSEPVTEADSSDQEQAEQPQQEAETDSNEPDLPDAEPNQSELSPQSDQEIAADPSDQEQAEQPDQEAETDSNEPDLPDAEPNQSELSPQSDQEIAADPSDQEQAEQPDQEAETDSNEPDLPDAQAHPSEAEESELLSDETPVEEADEDVASDPPEEIETAGSPPETIAPQDDPPQADQPPDIQPPE